jgi:hypothetical protein
MTLSRLEIIPSRLEMTPSRLEIISSRLEIIPSRLEITPSRLEIISSRLEIIPSRLEITPSRLETTSSRLETARRRFETSPGTIAEQTIAAQPPALNKEGHMGTNYIPGNDTDYTVFFSNLERYVDTQTHGSSPPWTHIPQADLDELTATLNTWKNAYNPILSPHSPEITREKNRVRKSSERYLRLFVNRFLRYVPVTDADRDKMRIPNRRLGSTPIPPPDLPVECDVIPVAGHLVDLKIHPLPVEYRETHQNSNHGVRIYWGVLGKAVAADKFRLSAPPESGEDLPHSIFTRRKKYRFDFSEADRGKTVYFCLCYENSKGEAGPWGPVIPAIIP